MSLFVVGLTDCGLNIDPISIEELAEKLDVDANGIWKYGNPPKEIMNEFPSVENKICQNKIFILQGKIVNLDKI